MRTHDLYITCPICDEELRVGVTPGHYSTNPHEAEMPVIEDLDGCPHANRYFTGSDPAYVAKVDALVYGAMEDRSVDAWEDEQSARYERWADR